GGGLFQTAETGLPLGSYTGNPIIRYADVNGDGLVSPTDVQVATERAFLGTPFPTQGASLSSALTLRRRFRIAGLLEYRGGNNLLNGTEQVRCIRGTCRASSDPSTPLADQVPLAAWAAGTSAGWVESASFLKLREISVAFTAPATWAGHLGAAGMTFTLAGRNLLTLTSYKGLDPELNAHGTQGPGFEELFTQPLPRHWTARLRAPRSSSAGWTRKARRPRSRAWRRSRVTRSGRPTARRSASSWWCPTRPPGASRYLRRRKARSGRPRRASWTTCTIARTGSGSCGRATRTSSRCPRTGERHEP